MTTLVLLPTTIFGVPSGNYDGSSTVFFGNAQPAASYYRGQGTVQTMPIQVTNLVGNVTIQATLNDQHNVDTAWFDIGSYGTANTTTTGTTAITVEGNFVWLRARVTGFTGGTINSANVIY